MLEREEIEKTAEAFARLKSQVAVAAELGLARSTVQNRLKRASELGLLGYDPVLPGFKIAKISTQMRDGRKVSESIQQKPDPEAKSFELPESHHVKGVSALVDAEGNVVQQWIKTKANAEDQLAAFRAMVDELKSELPRIEPTPAPRGRYDDLLNQFVVTDSHFGMLAWKDESGDDYDLGIAEKLLLDWFSAAISEAPKAHTAVLAQLGDLMHHDGLESVTPASRHVLDADSRLQKVIRVVIRTIRRIISMLLETHEHVHVVMASGNHDPASSAWLREMLAVMYEDEPRVSVDSSPMLYYAYEWGKTALFYHHGHKSNIKNLDVKCAGTFRELFGRTDYAYCHFGHLHSDEGHKTDLMHLERHETLAAQDAYSSGGPWLTGRSAKRITYHKKFGEVSRARMSPEMVAGSYLP